MIFTLLLSSVDFFKLTFSKHLSGIVLRVPNGLYPDQDRRSVGTDLGTNCLQRLLADNKSRR